ncbi:uncharacterized protein ALTATR162_LOCUS893 [Alternaria atra]|uniref:NADAR domain-containing protein n=1 Tax=Alternaria atra TaxID=119953 RepID=A0A8J2HUT1_9PLEO|nr:uncharacterized protein ALTATR162_LOCUS893 [Alternaria atra]CAG5141235.1 unnamed protein product [Alternaria atra]
MPKRKDMPAVATTKPSPDASSPIFFYGPHNVHGQLSQMYMSPFENTVFTYGVSETRTYCCAEQYFQFAKASFAGDTKTGKRIMETKDPFKQKRLGKAVRNLDVEAWKQVRYQVVLKATLLKFTVSENSAALRAVLFATKNREIVEASPDPIWGCGLKQAQAEKFKGTTWPGRSLLGKALMDIRERLVKQKRLDQAGFAPFGEIVTKEKGEKSPCYNGDEVNKNPRNAASSSETQQQPFHLDDLFDYEPCASGAIVGDVEQEGGVDTSMGDHNVHRPVGAIQGQTYSHLNRGQNDEGSLTPMDIDRVLSIQNMKLWDTQWQVATPAAMATNTTLEPGIQPHTTNDALDQNLLPTKEPPMYFDSKVNGFLSNQSISEFTNQGVAYHSVEQFVQAMKAKLYGHMDAYDMIMDEADPLAIAEIHVSLPETSSQYIWEYSNNEGFTMQKGIRLKFEHSQQSKALQDQLLTTNDRVIAYLSADNYWGIGIEAKGLGAHTGKWPGHNRMGLMLMQQRQALRNEQTKEVHTG